MHNVVQGFITYVDETGRLKTLFARNGTFSVVEEVSVEQAQENLDHITTGHFPRVRQ